MSAAAPSVPAPAPAQAAADAARVSYWQVVGGQLRKNRVAMAAWALVKGLVGVAVFAPLLAFNLPLVHADGGFPTSPLLSSLFDRTWFEGGVDVFFNLLLLALPVWLLVPGTVRALRAGARGVAWARVGRTAVVAAGLLAAGLVLRAPDWLPPFLRLAGGLGLLAAVVRLLTALRFGGLALLVVVGALELWAVVGGKAALAVAVLGVVLPGAVVVGLGAAGRLSASRARFACLLLCAAGLVAIQLKPQETSLPTPWRGPESQVAGWTLFPPVPFHPNAVGEPEARDRARSRPDAVNWLGCDVNGRDVATRIVFGARISVTIGLVGVSIYILIGILLGSLAGYYGGKVDLLVMRLVEIMICFPTMFLLLTIIAVFESRSIFLIMAAIGFVGWPGVTRLVRGEFLRQRNLDYVTAAQAVGLRERRVIFRHVLPNCLGPVLVSASFGIAGAILTESGIAFLGLGDQTAVSWGQMLTTGRSSQEWHLILVPGFAIFFVVTVFNLLGEGLRDALDPKLRR